MQALTSLINLVLEGKIPTSICPFFFGVTLVALEKKDGGVRPIAVDCTLHRLAAKSASNQIMRDMGALLAQNQLEYGTPLGAKAAVHTACICLHNLQPDEVLLKLDFRNAFNCICRDKMLKAVEELVPELLPFVHSIYCKPSPFSWGDKILQSSKGVQQGTLLAPCCFVSQSAISLYS